MAKPFAAEVTVIPDPIVLTNTLAASKSSVLYLAVMRREPPVRLVAVPLVVTARLHDAVSPRNIDRLIGATAMGYLCFPRIILAGGVRGEIRWAVRSYYDKCRPTNVVIQMTAGSHFRGISIICKDL